MLSEIGNTFKWFIGVVEDREDPLKMGRVKVRALNVHGQDKVLTPTDHLPWALIVNSPLSAGIKEVGMSPTGLMVGSTVVGFFADGELCQIPMVLGTIAGIPDNQQDQHEVSQLAREKNNVEKALMGMEPNSAYNSKYPYNKTFTTESGHVIEIDDSPGAERIHIFHKEGTYIEIDNEGTRVDKTVGDQYRIMVGSEYVQVKGNVNVIVEENASFTVLGDATMSIRGKTTAYMLDGTDVFASGEVNVVNPNGNISINAQGDINMTAGGTINLESQGNMALRSQSRIDLNPTL